jgi:hypothetical protein
MIPIQKNIPIPELSGYNKYPFHLLDIGDSFLLPKEKNVSAVCTLIHNAKKKNPKKDWVKARENDCFRVWRIK